MIKLNTILRDKLLLQAEEANEQGMTKLGNTVLEIVGTESSENIEKYSYSQMTDDVHRDLWKVATRLMKYYDVQSLDIEKLDKIIASWSNKVVQDLELSLDVDEMVKSTTEPKLPGEY